MNKMNIDMDLTVIALGAACLELYKNTDSEAIGIVICYELANCIGEVIAELPTLQGLKVTILKDFPIDWWFVYNYKNAVFSPGA